MTIERSRELNQVLIRLEAGQIGAAAYYNEGLKENGAWIPGAVSLGQAVPLSLVDEADAPTLTSLLGEVNVALAGACSEHEQTIDTMRRTHAAELEAKDANLQALMEQAAQREQEAQQAITDLQAALTASEQALQAKTTEAATLQREVEGLTLDLEALRASIQGEPAPEEPAPEA